MVFRLDSVTLHCVSRLRVNDRQHSDIIGHTRRESRNGRYIKNAGTY